MNIRRDGTWTSPKGRQFRAESAHVRRIKRILQEATRDAAAT